MAKRNGNWNFTSDAILLKVFVLSLTLIFSFLVRRSFVWSSPEFSLSSLEVWRETLLWPRCKSIEWKLMLTRCAATDFFIGYKRSEFYMFAISQSFYYEAALKLFYLGIEINSPKMNVVYEFSSFTWIYLTKKPMTIDFRQSCFWPEVVEQWASDLKWVKLNFYSGIKE